MYEERVGMPINLIVILMVNDEDSRPQVFVEYKKPFIPSLMEKIETYKKENQYVS